MNFIKDIEKNRYEEFVKNHKKSHFLQSYTWGEFSKKERNLTPHFVGLENDNKELVAATLLLEKKLPLGLSYFYAPRGYILDFNNIDLLKEFTEYLRVYAKENKAIFIKLDPDIIYHSEDKDGNIIIEKDDNAYNSLLNIGYRHLGFTKNFETTQPRYTFRIDFTKSQNFTEIKNSFSKTTNQRIKKAEDLYVEVKIGEEKNIDDFYKLMTLTENRKDFISHNKNYYQSLYNMWNQENSCNLFLGSVDMDKIINTLNNTHDELKREYKALDKVELSKSDKTKKQELEKRIVKIEEDLSRYANIITSFDTKLILSAHFILEYGDKAWVLYAGNHNILADTCTNYKTYEEHIKYYYNKGLKTYDQFGTIGDLRNDNPLMGLHEFKKKFGGDYVEFIGEFDYVTNKLMYFVFTKLVPFYRNMVKFIAKKKNKE